MKEFFCLFCSHWARSHANLPIPFWNCNFLTMPMHKSFSILKLLSPTKSFKSPLQDTNYPFKFSRQKSVKYSSSVFCFTLFEKPNFCPKIQFWQKPLSRVFHANFFDNFSREIEVVNSKKVQNHNTFTSFSPKKSTIFSGNQSWIFGQKWRFRTVCFFKISVKKY